MGNHSDPIGAHEPLLQHGEVLDVLPLNPLLPKSTANFFSGTLVTGLT